MKKHTVVLLVAAMLLTFPVVGCNRQAVSDVPDVNTQMEQAAQEAESLMTEVPTEPIAEMPTAAITGTVEVTDSITAEPTPMPITEPTAEPTEAATAEPTAEATEQPTPGATGPNGEPVHVVQPGENLFRIALRYGTTVETIAQANGIINPNFIYVGQELIIPTTTVSQESSAPPTGTGGETVYTVQPGDNLFRIALKYNMSYLYLAQYNGITNPNLLVPGQQIRIPPQP